MTLRLSRAARCTRGQATVELRPSRAAARSERGQAAIEITGLLPLLVIVAFCSYAVLAARSAAEHAAAAAHAGAVASIQGGDARAAAREALPAGARRRATIELERSRIHVAVTPRVPLLARRLRAHASADAGGTP